MPLPRFERGYMSLEKDGELLGNVARNNSLDFFKVAEIKAGWEREEGGGGGRGDEDEQFYVCKRSRTVLTFGTEWL